MVYGRGIFALRTLEAPPIDRYSDYSAAKSSNHISFGEKINKRIINLRDPLYNPEIEISKQEHTETNKLEKRITALRENNIKIPKGQLIGESEEEHSAKIKKLKSETDSLKEISKLIEEEDQSKILQLDKGIEELKIMLLENQTEELKNMAKELKLYEEKGDTVNGRKNYQFDKRIARGGDNGFIKNNHNVENIERNLVDDGYEEDKTVKMVRRTISNPIVNPIVIKHSVKIADVEMNNSSKNQLLNVEQHTKESTKNERKTGVAALIEKFEGNTTWKRGYINKGERDKIINRGKPIQI